MVVLNKELKDQKNVVLLFRHIIIVNTLDFDEDQTTFYDKFIQKTMKFQKVHILYLATVC